MLKGIKQTDKRLLFVIQKYGCLFLCFAQESPMIFEGAKGIEALNFLWEKAMQEGAISSDLNGDGDFDDVGEAEVKDHNKLASLFALRVRYDNQHHSPEEKIPPSVKMVFGCYFWKGTHFVNINKKLVVTNDPMGQSNTVKNGTLKSTRWYYADN